MQEINSIESLNAALEAAGDGPVFLFKHSTRCPISSAAYRRVQDYLQTAGDAAPPVYCILVIESRPVSNAIAERFGVAHQSPQAILIKNQRAVWHASHGAIDGPAMTRALASLDA
ncbi:MAG TPA: bacillithiol system redox-active protein YtxJ [Candidatus Hydrogenedentes bacterium]|nr:bacillithiol system redox-active protein YtxJ [Candidatus Hydrogenedentota bacterium]